jgi:predicted nucleic acid-binding protein
LTFFVDANVFIYAAVSDPRSEACEQIVAEIVEGAPGRTSVAVLEEVWHIELSEVDVRPGTTAQLFQVLSPVLPVTPGDLSTAFEIDADRAGANDRVHVATCVSNGIETIVSADHDFDEFTEVRRVDPLDADAVAALLALAATLPRSIESRPETTGVPKSGAGGAATPVACPPSCGFFHG